MEGILQLRKEVNRLRKRVTTLGNQVSELTAAITNSNFLVVASHTELASRDAHDRALVVMLANSSGQFAMYVREVTAAAVDGTNVVVDVFGTTFVLYR